MSLNVGSSLLSLTGVLLVGASACTKVAPSPAPPAPSRLVCPTGYAVTVQNNASGDVDVWWHSAGREEMVGTVSPGTIRDLPLDGDGAVDWRWPPENPPRFHGNADVTFHMHCR